MNVFTESNTQVFRGFCSIVTMENETFGQRVKRLREALNLTQAQLAKRCGMAWQSTIGNIEAGNRSGSRNVAKLAQALGVSAHYLETGKGDPGATVSPEAAELAAMFDRLPTADKERMRQIILLAVGPAAPDELVEERMPATKKRARH